MKCPFCTRELIQGEDRAYETLVEHIFDPNNEYGIGERISFECNCSLSRNCFWGYNGELFANTLDGGQRLLFRKMGYPPAFYSMAWKVEEDIRRCKEDGTWYK